MDGPTNYSAADDILLSDRCSYGCTIDGCPHEMAAIGRAIAHAIQANTAVILATGAHRLTPADRHQWLTATDPEDAAEHASPAVPTGGTA